MPPLRAGEDDGHTAALEVLYPVYVPTCVLIRSVLKIGTRCFMLAVRSERLALRLSARGAVTRAAQEPRPVPRCSGRLETKSRSGDRG